MTKSPLTTPAVALGTWDWGDSGEAGDGYFGSALTESGLREVVEKAQANGFTLWDTAAVYGMGRSVTVLAKALEGYDRGEYQLSTKFTPQIARRRRRPGRRHAGAEPEADGHRLHRPVLDPTLPTSSGGRGG
ncbi:aldo/keto reductase [Streptomyces sp. NPDC096310]|uniref:aldo/keto reductase n=1 Tax=Streptomyces sp. NPDC096310 TaxID=3366082 RepID=UPI003825AF39